MLRIRLINMVQIRVHEIKFKQCSSLKKIILGLTENYVYFYVCILKFSYIRHVQNFIYG